MTPSCSTPHTPRLPCICHRSCTACGWGPGCLSKPPPNNTPTLEFAQRPLFPCVIGHLHNMLLPPPPSKPATLSPPPTHTGSDSVHGGENAAMRRAASMDLYDSRYQPMDPCAHASPHGSSHGGHGGGSALPGSYPGYTGGPAAVTPGGAADVVVGAGVGVGGGGAGSGSGPAVHMVGGINLAGSHFYQPQLPTVPDSE